MRSPCPCWPPPSTPSFFIFSGTSAGSPPWSGLAALGDQLAHRRLGFINFGLYRLSHFSSTYASTFHDIPVGNNNLDPVTGFNTAKNWDAVTGLGTPNANALLYQLTYSCYDSDNDTAGHDNGSQGD